MTHFYCHLRSTSFRQRCTYLFPNCIFFSSVRIILLNNLVQYGYLRTSAQMATFMFIIKNESCRTRDLFSTFTHLYTGKLRQKEKQIQQAFTASCKLLLNWIKLLIFCKLRDHSKPFTICLKVKFFFLFGFQLISYRVFATDFQKVVAITLLCMCILYNV